MTGSHREPAESTIAGLRATVSRYRMSRIPAAALVSATAIVAISGIAFAADNHLLSSGDNQDAMAVSKLCGSPYRLPKPIARQFTFHDPRSRGIRGLAFCANSSYLAAADGNGHVYVWSMARHRIVVTLHDPRSKGVNAVAYRPRTRTLAAADADGSVYLWQPGRARPRRLTDHASKGVRALAFSPDGTLLAAADGNGHAYIWSLRSDRVVTVLGDAGSRGVASVAFSTDAKAVATGDANGSTYAWTLTRNLKPRLQARLHETGSKGVRAVAFRPGTKTIAIADGNGSDYVWVPGAKGSPRTLTDPASRGIDSEVFAASGAVLATGDAVGRVYFWALSIYKVVEFYPAHRVAAIRAVAISPDRRRAAAGGANGTIYIADVSRIGISVSFASLGTPHAGG